MTSVTFDEYQNTIRELSLSEIELVNGAGSHAHDFVVFFCATVGGALASPGGPIGVVAGATAGYIIGETIAFAFGLEGNG